MSRASWCRVPAPVVLGAVGPIDELDFVLAGFAVGESAEPIAALALRSGSVTASADGG